MIRPESLQPGDEVRIVSTARKISLAEVQPAVQQLETWGLKVTLSEHLFAEDHQFAGSIAERLNDFQTALQDRNVRAILCARGGYGTVQIIDQLTPDLFTHDPKWIIGYSDVTVLHNRLDALGICSLHASMPINFSGNTQESLESLRAALFGEAYQIDAVPHAYDRFGTVKARLCGGNLSMLYSQTGSATALQPEGKILFMEDLDEYLYHIDRMLYNLKRNGYFNAPAAVIIGGMSDMNDNQVPFGRDAETIIRDHLDALPFPVAFGFPAGHLPDNRALIMGGLATLKIDASGKKLIFSHGQTPRNRAAG